MKSHSTRARLLASSMICGAVALAGGSAFAQSTTPQSESNVSEVVVTGSRIPTKDFTANSPYVSVNADAIKKSGATQIDTLLNQLPQFVPALTVTSNNPSSGAGGGGVGQANISLRGLGPNRNLVLVDGRRVVPSDGLGDVNVNIIPASLVERVEVITGGASAVYGSDAVSGVVNFILKDHYQGAEVRTQYGISSRGDGREWTMGFTMGGNFAEDRGNLVVSADYDRRDSILQGARAFSRVARAVGTDYDIAAGSSTTPDGRYDVVLANAPTTAAFNSVFAGYGATGCSTAALRCTNNVGFNQDGTLFNSRTGSHFTATTPFDVISPAPTGVTYNFAAVNNLTLPFQRYNLFASGNYSIWGDYLKAFAQVLYSRTTADNQLAASPASSPLELIVPVTNPYVSNDLRTLLASRTGGLNSQDATTDPFGNDLGTDGNFLFRKRFLEAGNRIDTTTTNTYQILTGLKGTFSALGHNWNWEAFYQNGNTQALQTQNGNVSYSAIEQLLFSPSGGVDECGGFNVFGYNNMSAGCANFISRTTHNITNFERNEAEIDIAGTLWDLPAGPLGIALGADWRNDSFNFSPDAILSTGDVIGFSAASPVAGSYKVAEVYGEAKIPLLADRPFFHYLGLEAGYRLSSYSTAAGTTNTWKYGGEWAPTDWMRFRGLVQQAVRAPSLFELFTPQQQNFPGYTDPCNANSNYRNPTGNPSHVTGVDPAQVAALCQAQGIPAALLPTFNQPNPQAGALVGGNPGLRPEVAPTWTLGAVFTPRGHWGHWFESLRASVDYYHINLRGVITTDTPDDVVGYCFNLNGVNPTYNPASPFCSTFTRFSTGEIGNIILTNVNLSDERTSGIDTEIDYRLALSDLGASPAWGALRFSLYASWLESWALEATPGSGFTEYSGTAGPLLGVNFPKWKAVLNTNWNFTSPWGPMSLAWRVNYIGPMAPQNQGDVITTNDSIGTPAIWYHNLAMTWDIKDNVQLYGGVNNLLDKQPPLYTGKPGSQSGVAANTDPSTFDVVGRYFFVGVTAKF